MTIQPVSRHRRAAGAALALLFTASFSITAAASSDADLQALLNAPLGSADPAKPVEVAAFNVWVVPDRSSAETQARIDPKRKIHVGDTVDVGTIKVDASKGPVTLVVDFGGIPQAGSGGQGVVNISLECMERPRECAIPMQKSLLIFGADRMGKVVLGAGATTLPLLVSRGSHSYPLPDGETVRVRLQLAQPRDFEPLLLKAWLIYGKHAVEVVPGQTSRSATVLRIAGAGALLLAFLWWRLTRRR